MPLAEAWLPVAALLGVLSATIVQFYKVDPTAAYLLLPYLAWSTYAAALTINIYKHNPQVRLCSACYIQCLLASQYGCCICVCSRHSTCTHPPACVRSAVICRT